MKNSFIFILFTLLFYTWTVLPANAFTTYQITDLGSLLDGHSSSAHSINNAGQVVGSSEVADGYYDWEGPHSFIHYIHAFTWQNGQMTDLGTLNGNRSFAVSVNDYGQVVGTADTINSCYATLWQDGIATDLGALAGFRASSASDINNLGQVVGYCANTNQNRACIWDNGSIIDLGTLGSSSSIAMAINDPGQVVGYDGGRYSEQAFIWQDGVMTELSNLGEGYSKAYDINNLGQIIGWSLNGSFLWQNGIVTRINMNPYAINNLGLIVGCNYTSSGERASVWQNGLVLDLNNLISPNLGWELNYAFDINDYGQIVGSGYHNGVRRAFLLTPVPEPGSFAVLALGMTPLMLALKRKRK